MNELQFFNLIFKNEKGFLLVTSLLRKTETVELKKITKIDFLAKQRQIYHTLCMSIAASRKKVWKFRNSQITFD